ncbi:hypothetical protein KPH14_009219 [Odynerus spinipes]|uniref:Odorant receptor n=1 Tax=Odynerus spinipes TaxID=1348599 RepID=A0AAD9RNX5_9HYME|nr:hypothetical protein KPH14_009219 [Odynerus spinipes]
MDVKDTPTRLNKIGPISFCVMCVVKYTLLIMHEDDIRYCFNYIETDWKNAKRHEERQIMFECADFSRRLIIISASFAFGGVIFYRLAVPLISPKIVMGNLTFRPIAYPIPKFIVDTRQSPWNEIMIGLQSFCGFAMSAITVGCCSMLTISALHACGQLKILMTCLNYLVAGRSDESDDVDKRLTNIVKRHVRVLSFIAFIENFLQGISFTELLGCTMNMCMLGYYVVTGWKNDSTIRTVTYITLIISFIYNIFIFCYIGEILAEECKKVAEVTYTIDWYRLKGRKSLSLVLIIAMSSSSNRLTAGKFIELSISSFGDVVKTSFAYLNMLRTVTS